MSASDPNSAELAELRERRLIDKVTEESRKRVIAHYLTLAIGFTAAVSLFGAVSLPAWIQSTVQTAIKTSIEAEIKANSEKLKQHAAEIERIQQDLNRRAIRQETLLDVAKETADRLNSSLTSHADKVRDLEGFTIRVGNLEAKIAPLREINADDIVANLDRLQRLSADVATLGQQLADLSRAAAARAAATTSTTPAPASPYTTVTDASLNVATQSRSIASEIAAKKSRTTVFVQFAGISRDLVDKWRNDLGERGYISPPAERIASAIGKFEVRYFHDADRDTGKTLAAAATAAVRSTIPAEARTARDVDLTGFAGAKPRPGTLELWYGPPQ